MPFIESARLYQPRATANWLSRKVESPRFSPDRSKAVFYSRSSSPLSDDTDGDIKFTVETPGGQQITCTDSPAEIARAPRMAGFVMGTNDLAKEFNAVATPDRLAFLFSLSAALAAARADHLHFADLRVRSATLEDVFLKLTGRRIRD